MTISNVALDGSASKEAFHLNKNAFIFIGKIF